MTRLRERETVIVLIFVCKILEVPVYCRLVTLFNGLSFKLFSDHMPKINDFVKLIRR